MSLKNAWKTFRNNYVINQVKNASIPDFSADSICRRRILFRGRVQKVGFRLEVCELAKRLQLTGWCKNLENGDVLAELQGDAAKIDFLVSFMESLKRIKIREKTVTEIGLIADETDFRMQ